MITLSVSSSRGGGVRVPTERSRRLSRPGRSRCESVSRMPGTRAGKECAMSVGSESGSPDSPPADSTTAPYVERGDIGYRQSLSSLQMQMIAIGGAVGVGLFLGLGDQLHSVGPGLDRKSTRLNSSHVKISYA